jgi:hypothetical protein
VNKAEATKQSESKPPQTETQFENLEADLSDSTKPTRNKAREETAANEKAKNLKPACEKILPQNLI